MPETTVEGSPGMADAVDEQLAAALVERVRSEGLSLVGERGLLAKMVLENALEGEMSDHLGYEPGDPAGRNGGNLCNGHRAKTVLTEIGPVELECPGTASPPSSPRSLRTRQRRGDRGRGHCDLVVGQAG
jgi:putative transposase